jgi:hypothetical protein
MQNELELASLRNISVNLSESLPKIYAIPSLYFHALDHGQDQKVLTHSLLFKKVPIMI